MRVTVCLSGRFRQILHMFLVYIVLASLSFVLLSVSLADLPQEQDQDETVRNALWDSGDAGPGVSVQPILRFISISNGSADVRVESGLQLLSIIDEKKVNSAKNVTSQLIELFKTRRKYQKNLSSRNISVENESKNRFVQSNISNSFRRNQRGDYFNRVVNAEMRLLKEIYQNPNRTFNIWSDALTATCQGRLVIYSSQFARLKNVTVDRLYCLSQAKGGENLSQVLLQNESSEFYITKTGCFKLNCPTGILNREFIGKKNYLTEWLRSVVNNNNAHSQTVDVIPTFTIALTRADYANLYWSMNDWYATYLMMTFFNQSADSTDILLVDAHPQGKMDAVWSTLFRSATALSELPMKTIFADMVWGLQGYNSVLKQNIPVGKAPYLIEEFRRFFLSRFHMDSAERDVDCKRISVLFLWRRDYVAHPRNPRGIIERKIANEQELIDGIQSLHPTFEVKGVQLDQFSMEDQLRLITQSDVLIGMHGAGLAHAMLLQKHASMIELFPGYYCSENNHFGNLARYRGVSYLKWKNVNHLNERKNFSTIIPVRELNGLLDTAVRHVCDDGRRVSIERAPLYVLSNYGGEMGRKPSAEVQRNATAIMCPKKTVVGRSRFSRPSRDNPKVQNERGLRRYSVIPAQAVLTHRRREKLLL